MGPSALRPSRSVQRLRRVALCLCCLALLMGRTVPAQIAPAGSFLNPQPPDLAQPASASRIANPAGQDIGDIASPRAPQNQQDQQNQQSPQTRTLPVPATLPPPPLTEFQQIVQETTGRTLPIFGASIFNSTPSTFAPVDNIPVTPDYVIGPGDELRLQVWGQVNLRGNFIVDRTGSIALPEVGALHVAGLQFSQLSDFLKAQLARVYRNFDLNVNLGQLRSIQVFVAGQARQPGSFTIGSLSTLLNALFASGGPTPQGSLRDIQVKRDGATITHFDLYDLLLHGDKSKDVRLLPGDVLFIPVAGPQVAVTGSVATPAIYELRDEKSFSQVVALGGGLTSVAAGSQLRVERISNHTQRSEIAVDLAAPGSGPPLVQDGDIISANSIVGRFKDAVTLRGNVANPGRYPWTPGMRLSDLIPNRDALVTRNYYRKLDQLGQARSQVTVPLPQSDYAGAATQGALGGQSSPATQGALEGQSGPAPGASSTRPDTPATGTGTSVGAALTANAGRFEATTDVILSAPDIDWNYAVIERQSTADLTTSLLPFNLGKVVLDKDQTQDLELLPGDVVTIFSKADIRVPAQQQTIFVKLEGEFAGAGVYSVLPGETLRQLLVRAGGLTPDAYLYASEFTRDTVRRVQQQRLQSYADTLESEIAANTSAQQSSALTDRDASAAALSAASARAAIARLRQAQPSGRIVLELKPESAGAAAVPDLELQDGDRFLVPRVPDIVAVEGQVYNANAFLYQKGKRVKDYLRLAGGPDRVGDRKREFILRADGSVLSHQTASFAQRALFVQTDFEDAIILPGDTIIVPPILTKGALMRNILDVSTIVQGFGLGAAAIQVLK